MSIDKTNEKKPEADCCAKIMEMMQSCCPGKEGSDADCCAMMQKMMAQNCCPEQSRKSG